MLVARGCVNERYENLVFSHSEPVPFLAYQCGLCHGGAAEQLHGALQKCARTEEFAPGVDRSVSFSCCHAYGAWRSGLVACISRMAHIVEKSWGCYDNATLYFMYVEHVERQELPAHVHCGNWMTAAYNLAALTGSPPATHGIDCVKSQYFASLWNEVVVDRTKLPPRSEVYEIEWKTLPQTTIDVCKMMTSEKRGYCNKGDYSSRCEETEWWLLIYE